MALKHLQTHNILVLVLIILVISICLRRLLLINWNELFWLFNLMSLFMLLKIVFTEEWFMTSLKLTNNSSNTWMCFKMIIKFTSRCKWFWTLYTLKWFYFFMNKKMVPERALIKSYKLAFFTWVMVFFCMLNSDMVS